MSDELKVAEVFHPREFILDELSERGWSLDYLAAQMTGDFGVNRLALDFYMEVDDVNLRMGSAVIADLSRIFGVSREFFINIEKAWIKAAAAAIRETGDE